MTRVLLAVVAGAALAAPLAAQQQLIASSHPPQGSVRGVVYDSLAFAPLRGALVRIAGTAQTAITDARGRFALDSVPAGQAIVLFSHPELDSLGFPEFGARIAVNPGSPTAAQLAIPSYASLHARLCGRVAPRPARGESPRGIVFGSLTDVVRGARVSGARVEVSWVAVDWRRGGSFNVSRERAEVRTDSMGNFYACDVPSSEVINVASAAGMSVTGRIDVLIGERRIARQDLRVNLDTMTTWLDSVSGLRAGLAVVRGAVHDERGMPLRGAQVVVDDAAADAMTDEHGNFLLSALPPGTQMVMIRAVGYAAMRLPVHLSVSDTVRLSARLRALTVLDTIQVTASRDNAMAQVADRVRAGWGHYLLGDQVRNASTLTSVLSQMPNISVSSNARTIAVLGRIGARDCIANIWIDGYRADGEQLRSIPPQQLVAVEWYPRAATAPWQYAPGGLADQCGVLVVWTQASRR